MLPIHYKKDENTGKQWVETPLRGTELLNTPLLNKSTAFTQVERENLGLEGLLPVAVETIEEQVQREYEQFSSFETLLEKNVYLGALQDRNEILYYRLACEHIPEMLPILYTPEVGEAVELYSHAYRRPRGLYLSYPERSRMAEMLGNRRCRDVDIIVCTDASAILGIGDQGVGGMSIPVAKLALVSLCGATHPARTLPIMLDVGTNNETLLQDPFYMGWRHERISGQEYEDFIGQFVETVKRELPQLFLHWEDFSRVPAEANLHRYRDQISSFNDDIQGTGVVCMAALYAALKVGRQKLADQRIVIFGFGAAGVGNADQIVQAMQREGLSESEARERIWAIDRWGLLVEGGKGISGRQALYARKADQVADWAREGDKGITLGEVVKRIHPTFLMGCSTVPGAFQESVIREMAGHVDQPIIFPLSNPTAKVEAHPKDLMAWTEGRALVATGSPFDPVTYNGRTIRIAQCNNAFVFPGVALGTISTKAAQVTDNMLWAAVQALSDLSPAFQAVDAGLLPTVDQIRNVCRIVGTAIASQAMEDGVVRASLDGDIESIIRQRIWAPTYVPIRPST